MWNASVPGHRNYRPKNKILWRVILKMETESQLKGSLEEVDVFDEHVPQPDNIQRVTDEEETSVLL